MKQYKIGVLGPSDIAFRRMVPAIVNSERFEYAGVAHASNEEFPSQSDGHAPKCDKFKEAFGGSIYESYAALIDDPNVNTIYIPLPPSEHLKWAEKSFAAGKHVLVEKPSTTNLKDTEKMIAAAKNSGLAIHENYAYSFHNQVKTIKEILESGRIGELRLVRATFSFPYRGESDFRYHADRGGGAIIDCGGYPVNFAASFLGNDIKVAGSILQPTRGHDIDTYGAAILQGDNGVIAQVSWGMDNVYRCGAELHGSTGMLSVDRLYSPPADYSPVVTITDNSGFEKIEITPDDQFQRSLEHLADCIENPQIAMERQESILLQARLIQEIVDKNHFPG